MKRILCASLVLLAPVAVFGLGCGAEKEIEVERDPESEAIAQENLERARQMMQMTGELPPDGAQPQGQQQQGQQPQGQQPRY